MRDLRKATQATAATVTRTEAEQRQIAERVRTSGRGVAAGATAGAATAGGVKREVAQMTREMDQVGRSTQRLQSDFRGLRHVGPRMFAQSAAGAKQLNEQLRRMRNLSIAASGAPAMLLAGGAGGRPPAGPPPVAIPPAGGAGGWGFDPRVQQTGGPSATTMMAEQQQMVRSLSRVTAGHFAASNAMRAHGALSTEFLGEMQKGRVSLRELGWQLGATTAKFGGWLAAGSLVYGTARGLAVMGQGAVQAASGVNQLGRVIDDVDATTLISDFGDLADEFNVAISEVTDTAFQMGKIFKDQDQALDASRSALYAQTIGELDPGDATKYLIAITNAFNFTSDQLGSVMDQVNEAQRGYGALIRDLVSGIAKAGGSFAAAGGEGVEGFSQLLAVMTTVSRVAGISGEVVGTAISRAPRFFRAPEAQQTLAELGFSEEARTDLSRLIDEAVELAPMLSGERLQSLASAIFGPLYGQRIGIPFLRQTELYKEILADTSPEKAAGSAQEELNEKLKQMDVRLKAVGVGMQQFGAELSQAGFLDAFGGIVMLLNEMIDAAVLIAKAFNALPDPLKKAIAYGTQLLLLMRLLQRMGWAPLAPAAGRGPEPGQAGTGMRGAMRARAADVMLPGGFQGAAAREQARLVQRSISDEVKLAQQGREGIRARQVQEQQNANIAHDRAQELRKQTDRMQREGASQRAIAKNEADIGKLRQGRAHHTRQVALLTDRDKMVNQQIAKDEAGLKAMRGRFGRLRTQTALAFARERGGIYVPPGLDRPTTGMPPVVGGRPPVSAVGPRVPAPAIALPVPGLAQVGQQFEQQAAQAEQGMRTEALTFGQRQKAGIARLQRGLGIMGNVMFAAFITFTIGDLIKRFWEDAADRVEGVIDNVNRISTYEEAQQNIQRLQERLNEDGAGPMSFIKPGALIDRFRGLLGFTTQAELEAKTLEDEINRQRVRRQGGLRTFDLLQRDVEFVKNFRRGSDEWRTAIERARERISRADPSVGRPQIKRLRERIGRMIAGAAAAGVDVSDLMDDIHVSTQQIEERFTKEMARFGIGGGATTGQAERLAAAYEQRRLRAGGDPEALRAARDDFYNGVESQVQQDLDNALAFADTPAQRAAAYQRSYQMMRRAMVEPGRERIERRREQLEQMRERAAGMDQREQPRARGLFAGARGPFGVERDDRLARLRRRIKEHEKQLERAERDQEWREKQVELFQKEIEQTRYQERWERREARLGFQLSFISDPMEEARRRIAMLNDKIQEAIAIHGRNSAEVWNLMQERSQQVLSRVQEQEALIRARGQLAESRIDPERSVARARASLRTLEDVLTHMQQNRARYSPREFIDIQAQINEARWRIASEQEREVEDLRKLRFDVQVARAEAAGQDVRAAAIRAREALQNLRQAETPAERLTARAALIRANAARRDQVFRTRMENIGFQRDIDRMTLEQEQRRLQRMLKDARWTRDQRREILRRLHQIKQEMEADTGTFDLAVGNIKLPTIYEIRRAIQGGVSEGPQTRINVSQTNHFTANGANAQEIIDQWGQQQAVAASRNNSLMRSAGLT